MGPPKKKSKGHKSSDPKVIPLILFFISSDLGSVGATTHAQALHDPPLYCDFE